MKALIFDASSLISMSMSCLLERLKDLKKDFDGKFIITKEVIQEVVDKPIGIKKFELEALRVKALIDEKILELPDSMGVKDSEIKEKTKRFEEIANNSFTGKDGPIKLIHLGESSCLGLSEILNEKNIKNALVVDERTLRMLIEKPNNLKNFLSKKLHVPIKAGKSRLKEFQEFKIIRSVELISIAYKKGLIKLKGDKVLDALLYALKFKGCSISGDEIKEIKRIYK